MATPSSTRQPALTGLTCATASMTGAGTDPCTVTLNAAAGAGGQPVSLSSTTAAVTVPSSVTVAAGSTTANFSATISAVSTAQTATLTASSGSQTETYGISLTVTVGTATLTLQSTSVPFGDVTDGIPAYQTVTLTSSGTAPVTLSAGSVSGTGYAISEVSFPLTLNPGASATLEIEFDPTTPGTAEGAVTLTSNSSAGTTSTISLSGTGVAPLYEVDLTWNPPADSSDPVAGYNIYRAVSGSSAYELLNAPYDSATSYVDATVASNTSYSYYVESVDAAGISSSPSNTFTISVP